jgi:hypothetical protein
MKPMTMPINGAITRTADISSTVIVVLLDLFKKVRERV